MGLVKQGTWKTKRKMAM